MNDWTIEHSRIIYGLNKNDLHFLDVTDDGKLCVKIKEQKITFENIVKQIEEMGKKTVGYASSFTLRLPQLITSQMIKLKNTFEKAREKLGYAGKFMAVYPVKVNQQSNCVTTVLESDSDYGLEAGTKAELLLIKALLKNEKHRRIICNGAKDPEYLDMIRKCSEEGYSVAISVESLYEAKLIVEQFKPSNADLVLRIKPYLTVEGHWSHSTGRDSKFGLSIQDLFDVIDLFRETGFASSVSTILGHVGSQITDIEGFRRFANFMTQILVELRQNGLSNLTIIDFGGGLPIDYTSSESSNLMERYAESLIIGIQEQLSKIGINSVFPNILVESGRGVTALGSLVVVKVLEVRSIYPLEHTYKNSKIKEEREAWILKISEADTIESLSEIWNSFHCQYTSFRGGLDEIRESEALIGELEASTRHRLMDLDISSIDTSVLERSYWHPEHIVIGNFSVFNSIGDWVLVDQHFPAIPIIDLDVQPETTVRLVDITCDSDGEFSQFHWKSTDPIWFTKDYRPITMHKEGMSEGIPVGSLKNIQDSYFVLALTGAYQDVIEMDHNLLGDLPDVELMLDENNNWKLTWLAAAESIEDILEDVGYRDLDIDEDPYMSDSDDE
jgi:arginine decarboxylase